MPPTFVRVTLLVLLSSGETPASLDRDGQVTPFWSPVPVGLHRRANKDPKFNQSVPEVGSEALEDRSVVRWNDAREKTDAEILIHFCPLLDTRRPPEPQRSPEEYAERGHHKEVDQTVLS